MNIDPTKILTDIKQRSPKHRSERAELINEITTTLNNTRQLPLKPITPIAINHRLAQLQNSDLYYILAMRKQINNWSKWFWWSTRASKKDDQKQFEI